MNFVVAFCRKGGIKHPKLRLAARLNVLMHNKLCAVLARTGSYCGCAVLARQARCTIKIFGVGQGWCHLQNPLPLRTESLPTPCFRMFLERSLNDPQPPHFKHRSLLTPSPSYTPSPSTLIKILIIHMPIQSIKLLRKNVP